MPFGILFKELRSATRRTDLGELRSLSCPGMYEDPAKSHNQEFQLRENVHSPEHIGVSLVHDGRQGKNVKPKRVLDAVKKVLTVNQMSEQWWQSIRTR